MQLEKNDQNSIPWVQKYRPHELKDLISHQEILDTLKTFVSENSVPNLLFYGPPGTGKTSTIVALCRQIYGTEYKKMVLELNASDERGIAVVRDQIKSFSSSMTLSKIRGTKLVILDEADMMTNTAQFALRRIIEKYSSNTRFCLISNYVSKIIPALQSRCTRFKFKQIALKDAYPRIEQICGKELLSIDKSGIEAVYHLSQGDMRRVVNLLQSLSMNTFDGMISQNDVYSYTGNPSPQVIQEYMDIILSQDIKTAFQKLRSSLREKGISMDTILREFYTLLLQIDLPDNQMTYLFTRIGDLQYRLSIGAQENTVLASLIGAFNEIKFMNDSI